MVNCARCTFFQHIQHATKSVTHAGEHIVYT